jgi:hypothetical protein
MIIETRAELADRHGRGPGDASTGPHSWCAGDRRSENSAWIAEQTAQPK